MADEETELDALYAAPLDQFVKVRNEIAAGLRKGGDELAAARVAALKKPSVSAWTINQLARSGSIDLQRLIKAGEALEQAQSRAISGKDSSGFEGARRDEASAISLLRTAAKQVLPSASAPILDRVVSSLRAGAATPEGRALIRQGRLTDDLEPPGFGAFSGVAVPTAPTGPAARKTGAGKKQDKIESLRKRLQEAEANATAREVEAVDLERETREAEKLAGQARRASEAARKKADAAAAQVLSIREELSELGKRG